MTYSFFFFFNDTATTEIYTLSLHDALPISHSAVGQCVGDRHDAAVQELCLVDRDDLGVGPHLPHDLVGRIHGLRIDRQAVVTRHRIQPGVAGIEVGLENLNLLAGDDGPPHPADELLALSRTHHA